MHLTWPIAPSMWALVPKKTSLTRSMQWNYNQTRKYLSFFFSHIALISSSKKCTALYCTVSNRNHWQRYQYQARWSVSPNIPTPYSNWTKRLSSARVGALTGSDFSADDSYPKGASEQGHVLCEARLLSC